MILSAHQLNFIPYLGHFEKIFCSDIFVLFDTIGYSKWGWSSRNKIKTSEGEQWLVIPVLTHGNYNQKIRDVKIDNSQKWKKKHIKAIEMAYSKSEFFSNYIGFFREIYEKEWNMLGDFNEILLKYILDELKIKTKIVKSSELEFSLEGEKSDLILDLCKKMNSNIFIFGETGESYAKIDDFKKENIEIIFQKYTHPKYNQLHGDFVPNLSVIDLLFNYGPNSLDIILENSQLLKKLKIT